MRRQVSRQRQRGFLVIAAVFLLVVLAGLVAYLTTVSTTSQAASAADFNTARAYQAAHAGIERGAYEILRNPGGTFATSTCTGGLPTQVDLPLASNLGGYTVTLTCSSASSTEGASTVITYSIVANGCNEPTVAGSCPNAATNAATYAERELRLVITN